MFRGAQRISPPNLKNPIPSPPKKAIPLQKPIVSDTEEHNVAFCFRDIDQNQGDTLRGWGDKNLLPKMVYKIADISSQTIREAKQNQSIKTYQSFPSKSKYKYPDNVTQDALWAAIHITGTQVLGGHVERNIFHVVFLDPDHSFAISQKFKGRNPIKKSQR